MCNTLVGFVQHTCTDCGSVFFLAKDVNKARKKDHRTFYCPNGHTWNYVGETDEEKLRRILKHTEQEFEVCMTNLKETVDEKDTQVKSLKGSLSYYKGQANKLSESQGKEDETN